MAMPQEMLAHTSEFGDSAPTPDGRDGCYGAENMTSRPGNGGSTVTTKT